MCKDATTAQECCSRKENFSRSADFGDYLRKIPRKNAPWSESKSTSQTNKVSETTDLMPLFGEQGMAVDSA